VTGTKSGGTATGQDLYLQLYSTIKPNKKELNDILACTIQSIIHQAVMSLSYDSLAVRRKRMATERALNNGDPLIVKKKARGTKTATKTNPTSNDTPKVSLFPIQCHK
jgi:hypothetical protein